MTEQDIQDAIHDPSLDPVGVPDIPLERCNIHFMVNLKDVTSLSEALDMTATSLGRFGMDAFYVLATDPDTGRQWVIHNGSAIEEVDERDENRDLDEDDDKP